MTMDQLNYSKNNRYRFALVGHTEALANAVQKASNPKIEEITIKVVRMGEAVQTAEALFQSGIEVVLGHMGTSRILREATDKIVVNIPLSSIDLIEAFERAREEDTSIGLTNYFAPRDDIHKIEELLRISIHPVVFRNFEEMERGLVNAYKNGIRVFVGGGVSRRIIQRLGGKHFVPVPRRKVVEDALEEARAMARVRRRQLESEERVRTIIQEMDQGIVGIDEYGRVDIINKHAKQILGVEQIGASRKTYRDLIKKINLLDVLTDGKPIIDKMVKINQNKALIRAFPIDVDQISKGAVALLRDVQTLENMNRRVKEELYKKGFVAKHTDSDIKGRSQKIRRVIDRAKLFAATDATVCIHGETGVGKELFAQVIHNMSHRRNAPFVAINCGALPENLLESELFGYEEGAFTGAKRGGKIGLLELAHKGTIFLDEIGDISKSFQVRLLRVIESKEVMRLGGDRYVPVDIRIVNASHRDLRAEVARERFRSDLYYRLSTLKLNIPPLRDRLEDVPDIIASILSKNNKQAKAVNDNMYKRMYQYHWPGNIRELCSFIESYLILLGNESINEALFMELMEELESTSMNEPKYQPEIAESPIVEEAALPLSEGAFDGQLKEMVEAYEYRIIDRTLKMNEFNRTKAAEKLGISLNTLWRKYNQKKTASRS